ERAVKNGMLIRNAAALVSPPRPEDREVKILEPEQAKAVLEALTGHPLHPIAVVAINSGMRRGELLGLQWRDVDLDRGTVGIERSVEETRAALRVKAQKTKRGSRNITLPADGVAVLRAPRLEQMPLRMQLGMGAAKPDTFVFSTIEGEPLSPDNLSRDWRRGCASKKLPQGSVHALRHTHASMLIASGVDILAVSRRLGHSKASITLDTYGHMYRGADAAAAKAIEWVLK